MKTKTILVVVFAMATLSLSAQKGSVYIGGNAGLSSTGSKSTNGTTTVDGGKSTNWTFSPEVGTFLTSQVQVGVGVTLYGSKYDSRTSPVSNINKGMSYGGTLYGRYFFGKESFKPFVGVNVTSLWGSSKTSIGNITSKGPSNFMIGSNINAGFSYAISKRFTTVGSFGFLGFTRSTQKSGNSKNINTEFGLDAQSLGNRFNVGFYYTICQK